MGPGRGDPLRATRVVYARCGMRRRKGSLWCAVLIALLLVSPLTAQPAEPDVPEGSSASVDASQQRLYFRLPPFRRGDFNADGSYNLADSFEILDFVFQGSPTPPCLNAADANGDRSIDLTDALLVLNNIFLDSEPPPHPGPAVCGVERDEAALPCASYPICPDELPLITHVLNRITFGPTEELLTTIQTREHLIQYLEEQLRPPEPFDQVIYEPNLAQRVENLRFGFAGDSLGQVAKERKQQNLSGMLLDDAIATRYQLLQVVTQFWNNHFHTQVDTVEAFFRKRGRGGAALEGQPAAFATADTNASGLVSPQEWESFREVFPTAIAWEEFSPRLIEDNFLTEDEFLAERGISFWKYSNGRKQFGVAADLERREYDNYRRLAFGDFRDLLQSCAKSVPMLIFLNSINNTLRAPNENFAREFFELYSLGADHVYTQRDIEELARVFTGWTVGWVERSDFAPTDVNFENRPDAERFSISELENFPDFLKFPTRENWDDNVFTWAFLFGNSAGSGSSTDGHDWGRKDLFLPQYGGVDSLGNPSSPFDAVQLIENDNDRSTSQALAEFNAVLDRVVGLRDCAKFISTKLIQLFVTDNLDALAKSGPMPDEHEALFLAIDLDKNGAISVAEWAEPIPLVLPNGRPPPIFEGLDTDGDRRISRLEYREPDLLLAAIETWQETGGSMREVLRTILFSDEFLSLKFYRAKVKTPLELAASTVRGLNGRQVQDQLGRAVVDIQAAGQALFHFPDPTGESELAVDNVHTVGLLERLRFISEGVDPTAAETRRLTWNFRQFRDKWDLLDRERTIDYFTLLLLSDDILTAHRTLAEQVAEVPAPAHVAFLLSLPEFEKQ